MPVQSLQSLRSLQSLQRSQRSHDVQESQYSQDVQNVQNSQYSQYSQELKSLQRSQYLQSLQRTQHQHPVLLLFIFKKSGCVLEKRSLTPLTLLSSRAKKSAYDLNILVSLIIYSIPFSSSTSRINSA